MNYFDEIVNFIKEDPSAIFGKIVKHSTFADCVKQKEAWINEIEILQEQLKDFKEGLIGFEYTIPRMGSRIDTVILYKGIIFDLEFKNFNDTFEGADKDQTKRYAFELENYHSSSKDRIIVPILVATDAEKQTHTYECIDKQYNLFLSNGCDLAEIINTIAGKHKSENALNKDWFKGKWKPVPTIIDMTRIFFNNSKDDYNLNYTKSTEEDINAAFNKVEEIINNGIKRKICFITGVPGAGKTLVGLKIAAGKKGKSVRSYLSGNHALVQVLRETIYRADQRKNEELKDELEAESMTNDEKKKSSPSDYKKRQAAALIQEIREFREILKESPKSITDNVIIFDESQRAWDADKMCGKNAKIKMSEPEFLLKNLNDKENITVVCLVGEKQEINSGEIGINGWFDVIKDINKTKDKWEVYYPDRDEFKNGFKNDTNAHEVKELDLKVPKRTFVSDKQYEFIDMLLSSKKTKIDDINTKYKEIEAKYPIYITRDLVEAKKKIIQMNNEAEGNVEYNNKNKKIHAGYRYGMIASSSAKRLREFGLDINKYSRDDSFDYGDWFLGGKDNLKSSYALERAATEYEIQGLELDFCVCGWDADLRFELDDSTYHAVPYKKSRKTSIFWEKIESNSPEFDYLINTYRVLLTRARQGMIIYVPDGSKSFKEKTDLEKESYKAYDNIYKLLHDKIGIKDVSELEIEKAEN